MSGRFGGEWDVEIEDPARSDSNVVRPYWISAESFPRLIFLKETEVTGRRGYCWGLVTGKHIDEIPNLWKAIETMNVGFLG